MNEAPLETLPGFRRRLLVTPGPESVRSELEDDYHCMAVVLRHEDGIVSGVEAEMLRAPWTTCPGAPEVLKRTFTGVPLDRFAARGEKPSNCTHLHDLAMLAAAHAYDAAPLLYDLLVCDPVDGVRRVELRRDGACVMAWRERQGRIVEPAALAGLALNELRPWIETLDPAGQEQARLLRWGTMIAHGRAMSTEQRADKLRLPRGQCFTFQPDTFARADYIVSTVRDFSRGSTRPLANLTPAP